MKTSWLISGGKNTDFKLASNISKQMLPIWELELSFGKSLIAKMLSK